ncbi:MAG TPA: hypothetical protein VG365_08090 [Solirubrobacteraceae bacterium]|jgi:hypothetical protein|nr:hypothetical protein [Solirubrobacteraceae bacterium]
MHAVVCGLMASFPLGGVAWDYGQYVLGLRRLGFDITYLEDTGWMAYDPRSGEDGESFAYGAQFVEQTLRELDPALAGCFHILEMDGTAHGLSRDEFADVIASTDMFLNVSGAALLRDEYLPARRKVLVDTDPGWNHFHRFPQQQQLRASRGQPALDAHDHFLTYAERFDAPDCPLPSMGMEWQPTRPPVVLDRWASNGPGESWTTVMMWEPYMKPIEWNGVAYGTKDVSFARIEGLPETSPVPLQIAVGGAAPRERWRGHGWNVLDATAISTSPRAYRDYVAGSRGEFSVAKDVYVATRSGWFSCRTVCYLASGRPAVVEDTGFGELIGAHEGLLPWSDVAGARAALAAAEADYEAHAQGARALAAQRFDSDLVLGELLERVGLG